MLTGVLTGVVLLVSWGLGMDMPDAGVLWLYTWLCAASIGAGTIALFAMAGSYGQLIGLLIFVGAAGLTRGTLFAPLGLLFWLVLGTAVVRWYDRKGLYRVQPDLLAHVSRYVQDHKASRAGPAPAPSGNPGPKRL